jgi:hypothetical protein
LFLNQLLEEYQESDNAKDKDELFKQFTDRLWKSKYVFKKYKKYYTHEVNESLLGDNQELISIFNQYNSVEYTVCKSFYKKRLEFIDYIRIHINNMYGINFDSDVYYSREYYKLILTPKKEYFRVIKEIKNGITVDADIIKNNIDKDVRESEIIKTKSINRKSSMKFSEYKKLINTYLIKLFENYIPVEDYEKKNGWEVKVNVDGWSEDNYVVSYFCKSLTGYMKDYRRELSGFKKRDKLKHCQVCGALILDSKNVKKYCNDCANNKEKIRKRVWKKKSSELKTSKNT